MGGKMQKVLLVQGLESMELAKLQLTGHKLIVINDENGGAVLQDILQGGKADSQAPLPKERVVISTVMPTRSCGRTWPNLKPC